MRLAAQQRHAARGCQRPPAERTVVVAAAAVASISWGNRVSLNFRYNLSLAATSVAPALCCQPCSTKPRPRRRKEQRCPVCVATWRLLNGAPPSQSRAVHSLTVFHTTMGDLLPMKVTRHALGAPPGKGQVPGKHQNGPGWLGSLAAGGEVVVPASFVCCCRKEVRSAQRFLRPPTRPTVSLGCSLPAAPCLLSTRCK